MKTKKEIYDILYMSSGTDEYHTYSPFPGYPVITDGAFKLAEAAECFWLLDIIGSYQSNKRLDPVFQVWTLEVKEDYSAIIKGHNDTTLIVTHEISFTDFPLDSMKIYLMNGVILLPSEY